MSGTGEGVSMTVFSNLMESARVILYHKQSTSAMTRFFRLNSEKAGEGVLVGRPLPQLATLIGSDESSSADVAGVVPHPGAIATEIEKWLALPAGSLQVDGDFMQLVEIPGAVVRVYLMRFTTIDPPFERAEAVDAAFVPLTQTRGLPPVQMELLRTAYATIMEG